MTRPQGPIFDTNRFMQVRSKSFFKVNSWLIFYYSCRLSIVNRYRKNFHV